MSWIIALITCFSGSGQTAMRPDDSHWSYVYDCNTRNVVGQDQAGNVGVWDARDGKFLSILKGTQEPIVLAKLLPDGKHILGQTFEIIRQGGDHYQMTEWDIPTGAIVWTAQDTLFDGLTDNGRKVFAYQRRKPARKWGRLVCFNAITGKKLFTVPKFRPGYATNVIEESKNGKKLLHSDSVALSVLELPSGRKLAVVEEGAGTYAQPAKLLGNGDEFFYAFHNVNLYSIPKGKVIKRINFPRGEAPGLIGWLPKVRGFVAFCGYHLMSYVESTGLVDHGKFGKDIPGLVPIKVLVGRNERQFVECWDAGTIPDTQGVICYDTKTCKKLWERPGSGVKILRNGQLVLENGDKISFVNIVTGRTIRSIHLQNFFAKKS